MQRTLLCASTVQGAPFVCARGVVSSHPIVSEAATQSTRAPAYEIRDKGPETPCVVLAWSAEQPELAGSVAPLTGPRLLGRGASAPDDPAPRLELARLRPSGPSWVPPLAGGTLSRRQLLLVPSPGGTVAVTSTGRCPMLLHGKVVESGVLSPGDTLVLQDVLVLLVVSRPRYWLPAPVHAAHGFPFGAADPSGIVGESPAIWELRDALAFAAQSGQHVLVHGESGTGKELAARAIHALSSRHRGPFVARNAATLPEGLVDAELFGNVRGYPHPSSPERPGLIGEADGGTLFLDEIGELRHDLQAHLLRVLDRGGEYQRLGDARARRSDLRLVAATNRPVASLKHDLAARFAIRVRVPGLDERREDIPLLLRHLLAAAAREHPGVAARYFEKDGRRLDTAPVEPGLVEALLRHEYTHHLRELNRLAWVALTSSRGFVVGLTPPLRAELGHGPGPGPEREPPVREGAAGGGEPGAAPREPSEREKLEAALAATGGKVAPAARLLGLKNRYALYRLMDRHGIRAAADEDTEAGE